MRVEVYYNLHKRCLSVRAMEGPNKGRVIGYPSAVYLSDVEFVVQPAGRERVLRERQKNIHAFARGFLMDEVPEHKGRAWAKVTYNPYKFTSFMRETPPPVGVPAAPLFTPAHNALRAIVDGREIRAYAVNYRE